MKYFTVIFDVLLFESIFIFLFSGILFLINDPYFSICIQISLVSGSLAVFLGLIGLCFNLFKKDPALENF